MAARLYAALLLAIAPLAGAQPADPADTPLRLAVALFRHGVRAPLTDLNQPKKPPKYTPATWPKESEWGIPPKKWGYLTDHGAAALTALGKYYAASYLLDWRNGFNAYFWADVDERTRATAAALAHGFSAYKNSKVRVRVASLPADDADPLFHPFKAHCGGTLDEKQLNDAVKEINANAEGWWKGKDLHDATAQLRDVLACNGSGCRDSGGGCLPIDCAADQASDCLTYVDEKCTSPIRWDAKFSFASTASQAFLLEYADDMDKKDVGWGRTKDLGQMLRLHEFFFDQTQRRTYPAQVAGSNLLYEIRQTINGETGACLHMPAGTNFLGLVGHDTNIANVGALLGLRWKPGSDIPANDALPGGALVFERLQFGKEAKVRILYIAQTPEEIRGAENKAVRYDVECSLANGTRLPQCLMTLDQFNALVDSRIAEQFRCACK